MSIQARNSTYLDNMYQSLKRKGLAPRFERPGIYCITINGKLAYIGKSKNMLYRMAQHYVGISKRSKKKYQILSDARKRGCQIRFVPLYYAKATEENTLDEELGTHEGEFIRKYLPPLNTQIPRAEDWRSFTQNPAIETVTLDQILLR